MNDYNDFILIDLWTLINNRYTHTYGGQYTCIIMHAIMVVYDLLSLLIFVIVNGVFWFEIHFVDFVSNNSKSIELSNKDGYPSFTLITLSCVIHGTAILYTCKTWHPVPKRIYYHPFATTTKCGIWLLLQSFAQSHNLQDYPFLWGNISLYKYPLTQF